MVGGLSSQWLTYITLEQGETLWALRLLCVTGGDSALVHRQASYLERRFLLFEVERK